MVGYRESVVADLETAWKDRVAYYSGTLLIRTPMGQKKVSF